MRILVTGSAGFIGSHVSEAFIADGHDVTGLDTAEMTAPELTGPDAQETGVQAARLEPLEQAARVGHAARLEDAARLEQAGQGPQLKQVEKLKQVEQIRADVRDANGVAAALRGVDLVCHHAAMVGLGRGFDDAPEYVSRNDLGTAVLLAQMTAAGVRGLVLASSMVVYGEGRYDCEVHGRVRPGPRQVADLSLGRFEARCPDCAAPLRPGMISEDCPADPRNVYAATKVAQETLVASWARLTGSVAAALRYHNVYGPRMPAGSPYTGVAAVFRSQLAGGHAPRVFEDGGQLRDFIHVRDVARANVAAARWACTAAPGTFRAFNVGSGTARSVGQLAAGLARAMGGPPPKVTGEYRLGDVRHIVASSERLRTELGWRPQVCFTTGLAELAELPD